MVGDPTEGAILVAAAKAGALPSELNRAYPRAQEIPFDSDRKRMVTVHMIQDPHREDLSPFFEKNQHTNYAVAIKGAPDVVLKLCSHYQTVEDTAAIIDEQARQRVLDANDRMTKSALRVLGVAYRVMPELPEEITPLEIEHDLIFVGLIGMIDPARPEVKPALEKAMGAGIRTIMITGDYPNTAQAIAESIGLMRPGHQVLTGSQLSAMDDAELQREVARTDVFARVSPEHKMRIVDARTVKRPTPAFSWSGQFPILARG